MAINSREDEIGNAYVMSMGPDLGTAFFLLSRKLIELHVVWQQYRQLYGTDSETVFLLNRAAGLFFKIVQDELWASVLLRISRMTDPPATGKRKNLTIQSLPALIPDPSLRTEVENLCKAAANAAEYAREHRNKRIAHQDHDYLTDRMSNPLSGVSRASIETMLDALRNVMNHIDRHFRDATVLYEQFVDSSGAQVLVSKLKRLERLATDAKRHEAH